MSWKDRYGFLLGGNRTADETAQTQRFTASDFASLPASRLIQQNKLAHKQLAPSKDSVEKRDRVTVTIGGRTLLDFSSRDYLGLSRHPAVVEAACAAVSEWGTAQAAERHTWGDLAVHRDLETALAEFIGTEAAILCESAHAGLAASVAMLMSNQDLLIYDEFIDQSVLAGARLCGAKVRRVKHNTAADIEKVLTAERCNYRNVLIAAEALRVNEGDYPDLPRLVELKERFGCWLLLDSRHALGVLGKTGRGLAEHFNVDPRKIDILAGSFSNALAAAGGYVAANKTAIEILRESPSAALFSGGLPPVMAAAALAALNVIKDEPARISRLQTNSKLMLDGFRQYSIYSGSAHGFAIVPIVTGTIGKTAALIERVNARGMNVSTATFPAVAATANRLLFLVTSEHSEDQIRQCTKAVGEGIHML